MKTKKPAPRRKRPRISKDDLNYWGSIFELKKFDVDACQSPHLKGVCEAFQQNLSGVLAFLKMPYCFAKASREYIAASVDVHGDLGIDIAEEVPDRLLDKITKLTSQKWLNTMNSDQEDPLLQFAVLHIVDESIKHVPEIKGIIEIAINSAIVLLWSAVEVFVADLWIAALNHGPRRLVDKYLTAAKDVKIDAVLIKESGYDLTLKMGDVLGIQGLETLGGCRLAYIRVFGESTIALFGPSTKDPVFPVLYSEMHLLREVRNVIAHRHGIVSTRYVDAIGKAPKAPSMAKFNLEPGSQIRIKGDDLRQFASAAIDFCNALRNLVDSECRRA